MSAFLDDQSTHVGSDSREKLSLYSRLVGLLNARLSLPLVYAGCHRILADSMPASNMFICIYERDGLRFPYYVDEEFQESSWDLFPKEGLTAWVIDTRKRYWMSVDPSPPAGYSPQGPMCVDWLGVPILDRDGKVLGVLAVQTYKPGERYAERDVRFIEDASRILALAIQLSRLDREIAVHRIATMVQETVEIGTLYSMIHDALKPVVPAARRNFLIARVHEAAGVFRPEYWVDEHDDYGTMHWPLTSGFSGYIYHVSKASFIYENGKVPIPPEVKPIGTAMAYWLGVPLIDQGRIIGIIVIQSYDGDDVITREDEYVINDMAPYITESILRMELLERLR